MEDGQNEKTPAPVPCKMNCGFYGNPLSGSMCSKCARDSAAKKKEEENDPSEASPPQPGVGVASPAPVQTSSPNLDTKLVAADSSAAFNTTMTDASPDLSLIAASEQLPSSPDLSEDTDGSAMAVINDEESADTVCLSSNDVKSKGENQAASAVPPSPPVASPLSCETGASATALEATPDESSLPTRPVQTKTNRCWKCNTRVGLLGFSCRCGYVFCGTHRYANAHDCDFEWKEMEREKLRQANPELISAKIQKI